VFLLDGSKEQKTILWGPISTIDQSSRPATLNTICDKDTPKTLNFAHNITDPIKNHKITKHNYRIWSVMSPTRNQQIARENQKDQQPPLLCFFQERVNVHIPTLNLFLGPRVSLKLQDALAPQFKAGRSKVGVLALSQLPQD
jgi:hypothetical protein